MADWTLQRVDELYRLIIGADAPRYRGRSAMEVLTAGPWIHGTFYAAECRVHYFFSATTAGVNQTLFFKRRKGCPITCTPLALIDDAGLAHLKSCKNLTWLHLAGTQVSDVGLALFKERKSLTHVTLQKTKVTAALIDELRKALPQCKIEWDGDTNR